MLDLLIRKRTNEKKQALITLCFHLGFVECLPVKPPYPIPFATRNLDSEVIKTSILSIILERIVVVFVVALFAEKIVEEIYNLNRTFNDITSVAKQLGWCDSG